MAIKDEKTREYLTAWGEKDVPTGVVTEGSIRPGHYSTFALMGWIQDRPKQWPIVLLRLAILRGDKPVGGMLLSMPYSPKTERLVCGTLEDFGWDGRIWPHQDHGWPEGTVDEQPLLEVLKGVDKGATLTFPPHPEKGIPTVTVFIAKRSETFHTAPFSGRPILRHLDVIRELVGDPTPFKSDWTK